MVTDDDVRSYHLWIACGLTPGIVLGTLCALVFILVKALGGAYYSLHFKDEEIEIRWALTNCQLNQMECDSSITRWHLRGWMTGTGRYKVALLFIFF